VVISLYGYREGEKDRRGVPLTPYIAAREFDMEERESGRWPTGTGPTVQAAMQSLASVTDRAENTALRAALVQGW
jgi:hypothetical protein